MGGLSNYPLCCTGECMSYRFGKHGTKMNIWVNTLLPKNVTYDSENLKCRLNDIKPF